MVGFLTRKFTCNLNATPKIQVHELWAVLDDRFEAIVGN